MLNWLGRLWGIRHIRWLIYKREIETWAALMKYHNIEPAPHPDDVQFLEDVKSGRA